MQLQFITTPEELQEVVNTAFDSTYQRIVDTTPKKTPIEVINSATLMERLDISEPTLIRWRQKGKIPFMQIGSAVRYDWYKVLAELEVKKQKRS